MTLLSIGDFHFKGTRASSGPGEYLVTLKGWEGGVPMRRDSHPIPQNHGDYDVPAFLESRTVPFTANVYASNLMQLGHRGRQFVGLFAQGQSRQVAIEMDGLTLWGMARAGDAAPTWRRVPGSLAFARASMELLFANPRLFGESRTFTGTPAFHYGNFTAAPVLTVTGSAPSGYTIFGPFGKLYTVTAALVSGIPHVIDMADGYLRIGGVIVSEAVSRADTWGIPGGASVSITVVPVSGTASASVLVTDTFI